MKTCVFCKLDLSIVGRAKEHVFPKWMLDEWEFRNSTIEPIHFDKDGAVISKRTHTFNGFLSGSVCSRCNHGWMSSLEGRCKTLILNLASGAQSITDLPDNDALALAAWTAKTAFALHTSANWRRVVPEEHIYPLDKQDYRLPNNVFVVGHNHKQSRAISWTQSTTWEFYSDAREFDQEDRQALHSLGYKIAIRVGGLFLIIFHNPIPDAKPCLWWMRHIPLYPRWSHPVLWRKDESTWPDQDDLRFHAFSHFCALGAKIANRPVQPMPVPLGPLSRRLLSHPPRRKQVAFSHL